MPGWFSFAAAFSSRWNRSACTTERLDGLEHLERDVAPELLVARSEHETHPTLAKDFEQSIRTDLTGEAAGENPGRRLRLLLQPRQLGPQLHDLVGREQFQLDERRHEVDTARRLETGRKLLRGDPASRLGKLGQLLVVVQRAREIGQIGAGEVEVHERSSLRR